MSAARRPGQSAYTTVFVMMVWGLVQGAIMIILQWIPLDALDGAGLNTALLTSFNFLLTGLLIAIVITNRDRGSDTQALVTATIVVALLALVMSVSYAIDTWDRLVKCEQNVSKLPTAAEVYACTEENYLVWISAVSSLFWIIHALASFIATIVLRVTVYSDMELALRDAELREQNLQRGVKGNFRGDTVAVSMATPAAALLPRSRTAAAVSTSALDDLFSSTPNAQ